MPERIMANYSADALPRPVPGSRAERGGAVVANEPLPLAVLGSRAAEGEGTAPQWPLVKCTNGTTVAVLPGHPKNNTRQGWMDWEHKGRREEQ